MTSKMQQTVLDAERYEERIPNDFNITFIEDFTNFLTLLASPSPSNTGLGNINVVKTGVKEDVGKQEVMMDILLSTVTNTEGMWRKTSNENHCSLYGISHCQASYAAPARNNRGLIIDDDLDDEVIGVGGERAMLDVLDEDVLGSGC